MLSRRVFGGCAVCAAVGLIASEAQAQPADPARIKRTVIQSRDLDDKCMTLLVTLEANPGAAVARHTHPGIESFYLLEGELECSVQDQPDVVLKAGGGYLVPPYTPHSVRAGDSGPLKAVVTYVVEKGKPLSSLA